MQVITKTVTFAAGTAVNLALVDGNGNSITHIAGIYIEPAVANTHVCYVGDSALATGTSTVDHVIRELQVPPALAADKNPVDHWEFMDQNGNERVEPDQFTVDGTTGEKARVTYYLN